jgi:hypothetical protein
MVRRRPPLLPSKAAAPRSECSAQYFAPVLKWLVASWNRMPKTDKEVAPHAWAWIGGALMAAAVLAAVIAGYFYFFHAAK